MLESLRVQPSAESVIVSVVSRQVHMDGWIVLGLYLYGAGTLSLLPPTLEHLKAKVGI